MKIETGITNSRSMAMLGVAALMVAGGVAAMHQRCGESCLFCSSKDYTEVWRELNQCPRLFPSVANAIGAYREVGCDIVVHAGDRDHWVAVAEALSDASWPSRGSYGPALAVFVIELFYGSDRSGTVGPAERLACCGMVSNQED